jgi:transcriptional regulator with XRE-family HTH domain
MYGLDIMTEIIDHNALKKGKATDISKHIADILMQYRRRRQLSQRHVADLIGVSFQQYQKYEKGRDRLSLERAILMCESLGVPLTIFTTEEQGESFGFAETQQQGFGQQLHPQKLHSLSDDENDLITLYRSLPNKAKKNFIELVKPIAKMVTNK